MRPLFLIVAFLIVAGTLTIAPHVYAQEGTEPPAAAEAPVSQAILREAAPRAEASAANADDQRRAQPRGSRPQGDNPRTGTAVPRTRPAPRTAQAPAPADRGRADRGRADNGRRTVIVRPPAFYNNYYYYPRRSYPYGYGAFGLGYFYYDPYQWYPGAYSTYGGSGYYPRQYGYGYDIGELRLQVTPRHAQVFVDGYYAGTVDDYDGAFQSMKLESGPYSIQITTPGYDPLDFKVRINPGQKTTYRGDLPRHP